MEYIKDYSIIEKNTLWVAKMTYGRFTGTYDDLENYRQSPECRDCDVLCKQPTEELQHFWNAYFEVCKKRYCFMIAKDFFDLMYKEHPYAFDKKPELRQKIFTLAEVLKDRKDEDSIIVEGCGNHYAVNWITALGKLGRNYDVINWTRKNDTDVYTVAGTEEELQALSSESNAAACGYKLW